MVYTCVIWSFLQVSTFLLGGSVLFEGLVATSTSCLYNVQAKESFLGRKL